MIRLCTKIWNTRKGLPYVYFIIAEKYLYIGETIRHPSIRFGEHLKSGSFKKNILKKNEDISLDDLEIYFFAFRVDKISPLDGHKRDLAIKTLENEIHLEIIRNFNFNRKYVFISDVSRTAPKNNEYTEISKMMARESINILLEELRNLPDYKFPPDRLR